MVSQIQEGHVEWTMPAPLWPLTGDPSDAANRLRFRTPTILRFASDSFMQDFQDLLTTQPYRLQEFIAAPETWSSPPNEPQAAPRKTGLALKLLRARESAVLRLQARGSPVIGQSQTSGALKRLKLFQPAHQRFYLVATCLVCRTLGLPDRRIDAGAQETATFVLRRLQPRADADPNNPDPRDCDEFAFAAGSWQAVSDPATLVTGEEPHPLSPFTYVEEDQRRRRLLVGLIPVGDRERLLQVPQQGQAPPIDSRQMMLKSQVIGPIANLEALANATVTAATMPPVTNPATPRPTDNDLKNIRTRGNDQIQVVSWYILLDLARFLETNVNALWQQIHNKGDGRNLPPALAAVWNTLSQTGDSGTNMVQALRQAYDAASLLETVKTPYDSTAPGGTDGWPNFPFRFYSATEGGLQELQPKLVRKDFEAQIVAALGSNPNPPLPVRSVAQASTNSAEPVWFTIRCVLERPNCGALTPPLASEPTVAFQLAAFFDPDAPARPIRIGLPVDTTPAGLRKFDKNTAFVMSDTLCGQVNRMSGMTFGQLILSVLPFPLHQDLGGGGGPCASGGMVCSFSIPIITICALILLIIFVKLLDIVFFWMPFFQICLPPLNLNAKGS
jgi:hypothetical protein